MTRPPEQLDAVLAVLRATVPGAPDLAPDTELLSSGLLDSLGIVAAVGALEEAYRIEFPPELLVPDHFVDACALSAALSYALAAAARPAGPEAAR
ncbi:phosphopantetheine-binding protein [Kitasatospora sp. NPDC049285]|uniref:phosphopantetheine-binding protein n=1 Tax=Kitasatospora sp. NPDC049285 TaxID=3157096 RepID=UPI00343325C8